MKTFSHFRMRILVAALIVSGAVIAQVPPGPQQPPPRPRFGGPIAGLTLEERAAFEAGQDEFTSVETPETGLGPIFNGNACVQCHSGPSVGGASPIVVTRFGRNVNGLFDPLTELGGSLLQRVALDPNLREGVPPEANVVALRQTPPLFGSGLIEAIPDATILANAARPKPDGIAGRAAIVGDIVSGQNRVGRFGWKAQHATLLAFAADAYINEMGITSRFFPIENAPNGNRAALAAMDHVADPEDAVDPATGRSDVDALADFTRLLAPPPRLPVGPQARAGEALFLQAGCAQCHTPTMTTGIHRVQALSVKTVNLYSDLLLHDMGPLGDGIAQDAAGTREMRTPPLWGLRASAPYLHDGRAPTIDLAIRAHDGEAQIVRDRYIGLAPQLRQQLIDFLSSL